MSIQGSNKCDVDGNVQVPNRRCSTVTNCSFKCCLHCSCSRGSEAWMPSASLSHCTRCVVKQRPVVKSMCLFQLSIEGVKEALSIMNFHLWHCVWPQWKHQLLAVFLPGFEMFLFLPGSEMVSAQINCAFGYFLSPLMKVVLPWKNIHVIFLFARWEWFLQIIQKRFCPGSPMLLRTCRNREWTNKNTIKEKGLRYMMCVVCRITGMKLSGVFRKNKVSLPWQKDDKVVVIVTK